MFDRTFVLDLYNVQFKNDPSATLNDNFITLANLEQKSSDFVPNAKNKHLPIMSEIFDVMSDTNCEYFVYTNNDIIVSNRLIKHVKETNRNCYPVSRLAIYPIQSLQDDIKYSHYQVAGFDTFVVKAEWWKQHKDKFPPYILGFPAWDVHYATVMMMTDEKTTLVNKWPPCSFHVMHESPWKADNTIPERVWNENLFWNSHKTSVGDVWNKYLFDVLLKRKDEYRKPFKNELELEKRYFKTNE
jgi:hypothetical protein